MALLDLGLPSGGNHPLYAAHLNEDLFGGLSTSGVLCEPVSRMEFAHPLVGIGSVTEVRPAPLIVDLSGRVIMKRMCACCPDVEGWDIAGSAPQPIRGDVFSKLGPDAFVAEAWGFSALGLGQAIVNNVLAGPTVAAFSLGAGPDPETGVLIQATIEDSV
eukprot:jgi/Tetstr1/420469/TSEL_011582.t1